MKNGKKSIKSILLIILIPIVLMGCFFVASKVATTTEQKKYYEIVELIENNKVSEFKLNLYSGDLTYKKRDDGKTYRYTVPDAGLFHSDIDEAVDEINKKNAGTDKVIKYDYIKGGESSWLVALLPNILLIGVMIALGIFFMKKMSGSMGDKTMGFGKAKEIGRASCRERV